LGVSLPVLRTLWRLWRALFDHYAFTASFSVAQRAMLPDPRTTAIEQARTGTLVLTPRSNRPRGKRCRSTWPFAQCALALFIYRE
jgi:hypothetical protein